MFELFVLFFLEPVSVNISPPAATRNPNSTTMTVVKEFAHAEKEKADMDISPKPEGK